MHFYWVNNVNLIEFDGPFPTEAAAKSGAETTFKAIQNGMALSLTIVKSSIKTGPRMETFADCAKRVDALMKGEKISEGHIRNGQWQDGDYPEVNQKGIA